MEARLVRAALACAVLSSLGAGYRSANFVVQASSPQFAAQVADAAEKYRHDLALEWVGEPLPNWSRPCPIKVKSSPQLGAGGATSFVFHNGEVFDWNMSVQGSEERILDSVLPHEVTHTIFASHFRQPLPRWADEGACTTVEHSSERDKQHHMLIDFLQTGRGIAFSHMFAMKEYPADILPLYAQGYSLARYLIAQGGKQKFLAYVGEGLRSQDWPATTQQFYGYRGLGTLQDQWLDWVRQGSPSIDAPQATPDSQILLASNHEPAPMQPASAADPELLYRGQNRGRIADAVGRMLPGRKKQVAAARDAQPPSSGIPGWDAPQVAVAPPATLGAPSTPMPTPMTSPTPMPGGPAPPIVELNAAPSPYAMPAATSAAPLARDYAGHAAPAEPNHEWHPSSQPAPDASPATFLANVAPPGNRALPATRPPVAAPSSAPAAAHSIYAQGAAPAGGPPSGPAYAALEQGNEVLLEWRRDETSPARPTGAPPIMTATREGNVPSRGTMWR